MAERLYEDIKFVTQQNPTQIVDDDGCRAYNSLLTRVRREFHYVDNVADFPEWSPRTIKYKDALVVSGQLYGMLSALTEQRGTQPVSPAVSAGTSLGAAPPTQGAGRTPVQGNPMSQPTGHVPRRPPMGRPSSGASDTQFPGNDPSATSVPTRQEPKSPNPRPAREQPSMGSANPTPPKRNEDGTIPFSLD